MTPPPEQGSASDAHPSDRRKLAKFPRNVVVIGAVILAVMWLTPFLDRDERNFITPPVLGAVLILLGVWFAFFARVTPARRRAVLLAALGTLGLLALCFRLEGYTGDMHPKIVLRWSAKPYELLDTPQEESATTDTYPVADLLRTTDADYPQFLGPERRATVHGIRLARDWKSNPPKRLWRQPIGAGWSAFAVVGDYAVTQEQRGDSELAVCYEVRTGKVVWSHATPGRFTSVLGGDGPRATPTIAGGNVYVQTAIGLLLCLDGSNGALLWSHDLHKEHGSKNLNWGRSGSPLVVDRLVIVSAGGKENQSLVACDAETGEQVWTAGSDISSYSSPAVATLAGVRQVLIVNQDWAVGHRLVDGKVLWRHPWPGSSGSNASASQAVPIGDRRVFLSKGYHIGCELLELIPTEDETLRVESLWKRSTLLKTKLTNVVLHDGHLFGLSQGVLECVDLATGKRRWKRGRYGHGQIVLVDALLLVLSETGDVALVEASSKKYRQIARMTAIDGKTWNNPALAGHYLLVRNAEEASCFELPLLASPDQTADVPTK